MALTKDKETLLYLKRGLFRKIQGVCKKNGTSELIYKTEIESQM